MAKDAESTGSFTETARRVMQDGLLIGATAFIGAEVIGFAA